MAEDWRHGGFGLYVHWPFCAAKCPYCDFNSHVSRRIDQSQWRDAYLAEMERHAAGTSDRVLNSIFFGGGTPSLMDPDVLAAVLEKARDTWTFANDIEITLEANPGSVEAGRFAGYAQAGVNRVSMGVQALNDDDLRRLGRIHTVAEARQAFDIARAQFDRVSFDLIYARQDQTVQAWKAELSQALSMAVDHLSLYQLTIEPGTAFGDRFAAGKLRGLPGDDLGADLYDLTQDLCGAAGLNAYEVSNHARPGDESRHNLIYWRYGDYLGIGPGAHGRITRDGDRWATDAAAAPTTWLERALSGGQTTRQEKLTAQDHLAEYVLMGLRLSEGIDIVRYQQLGRFSAPPPPVLDLVDQGYLALRDGRLLATAQGRLVLNRVIQTVLDDPLT